MTKGGAKSGKSENVQVILRVRPISKKEIEEGCKDVVGINISENCVYVEGAGVDGRAWSFDAVYNNSFSQKDVYLQSVHPVVETVLQGYNATIFAYGQSGTGKTYSMCGRLEDPAQHGIIPHALNHMFSTINELKSEKMEYYVQASFVEIYNGKCRDLLVDGQLNLELKENAQKLFFVKDLSLWDIKSTMDAMKLMEDGLTRREVKSTNLNSDSSRSHSLFTVYVRTWDKAQDLRTEAKLNLVDLAGSERQSKTGASGDTLKEGNNINLSLTALGTVIDCLVKAKPHIPYRSSPLTMLLKDGLGGTSRTIIVGTIGPTDVNAQETVSTLRFIDRAKQIKNKPKVQMDPKDARIAELMEEVKKLKKQLGIEEGGMEDEDGEGGEGSSSAAGGGGGAPNELSSVPSTGALKKRRVTLYDDEMEALKRRIEELEVQLQATTEGSNPDDTALVRQEMASKMSHLKDDFSKREQELLTQISDLKDRADLTDFDSSDVLTQHQQLLSLCFEFLASIDRDKLWIGAIQGSPSKHMKMPSSSSKTAGGANPEMSSTGQVIPSVDDIARGFRMLEANGVDMRFHTIRRDSFVKHPLPPHPPPPSSNAAETTPTPSQTDPQQGGGGGGNSSSSTTTGQNNQFIRSNGGARSTSPSTTTLPASSTGAQLLNGGGEVIESGPEDNNNGGEEGGTGDAFPPPNAAAAAASKKEKKAKKEKKSKKNKKGGSEGGGVLELNQGGFVSLETVAISAELPREIVDAVVKEIVPQASSSTDHATSSSAPKLPPTAKEVKEFLERILEKQRIAVLDAFSKRLRTESVSADASVVFRSPEEAAELLTAFSQLREEADLLGQTVEKQKNQIAKSRAVAEKKIAEVTQLKEHVDALRDELAGKQQQYQVELAQQQDRMVTQFNKKMEQLVQKHQKNLVKERKQRDSQDEQVQKLESRIATLEQEYDVKVLEYENLMRDYEQMKVEHLRKLRDLGGFGTVGSPALGGPGAFGEGPTVSPVDKMRSVVNATVALDKITGKSHLLKTEDKRIMPNSAPLGALTSLTSSSSSGGANQAQTSSASATTTSSIPALPVLGASFGVTSNPLGVPRTHQGVMSPASGHNTELTGLLPHNNRLGAMPSNTTAASNFAGSSGAHSSSGGTGGGASIFSRNPLDIPRH